VHIRGTVLLIGELDLPESLAKAELVGRAVLKRPLPSSLPPACLSDGMPPGSDPVSDPAAAAVLANYWMETDVVGDALHTSAGAVAIPSAAGPQPLVLVASGVTAGPPDVLSWIAGLEFAGEHLKVNEDERSEGMDSTLAAGNVIRGKWTA